MELIVPIVIFVAGAIVGALVTRKNLAEVNAVVREAKELAAKVDTKLDEIRDANKKPARKPRATKKTTK
jgi:archaellum component FlaG (FlaF/FlaG flagellin family)